MPHILQVNHPKHGKSPGDVRGFPSPTALRGRGPVGRAGRAGPLQRRGGASGPAGARTEGGRVGGGRLR